MRAFRIARAVTGADARWEVVERLEGVDKAPQLELMGGVDRLVEETTRWYLTWEPEADIEETIAAGRDGFERLAAVLGDLGSDERRRRREQTAERLVGAGRARSRWRAPTRVRPEQRYAPDMVWVAGATGRPIEEVAEVFFEVGAELRLDWMETELERVPATTRMQRWALQAVREDAAQVRRELAGGVLAETDGGTAAERVQAFLAERGDALRRLEALPALALARGRAGPRRAHAGRPPAARARRLSAQPRWLAAGLSPRQATRKGQPMSSKLPAALAAAAALLAVPVRGERAGPTAVRYSRPVGTAYGPGFNCRTSTSTACRAASRSTSRPTCPPTRRSCSCSTAAAVPASSSPHSSGWREEADRSGLIAVFPTGQRYRITETGRLSTKWADFNLVDDIEETETPPADDVGFVDDMLADIEAGLSVDSAPRLRLRLLQRRGLRGAAGGRPLRDLRRGRLLRRRAERSAHAGTAGPDVRDRRHARPEDPRAHGSAAHRAPARPGADPPQRGAARLPEHRAETLGLDEHLYSVIAEPHSTSFRWPGTDPLFRFTMLDGLTHRYPDDAAREFGAFFAQHRLP